jgi:hypothetical protein
MQQRPFVRDPFYTPWRRVEQIEPCQEKAVPVGVAAKDETRGEERRGAGGECGYDF